MATKKWLEENKEYMAEYHRIYNKTHKDRKKAYKKKIWIWFQQYKSTKKCELCPEDHPNCLDFHHKNPKEKDFSISSAIKSGRGVKTIKKEMLKCMIVCANCHRKLHWPEKIFPQDEIVFGKIKKIRVTHNCIVCGVITKSKMCKECYDSHRVGKVERPSKEILEKMLWEKPTIKIAQQFGVSDKAVEKWSKRYNISKPPRGYWSKTNST